MRIAQVAPLYESVPPKLYGGTERVVAWLADELVRQGHEVTLFATGDSHTRAQLVPCWPRGLRLDPATTNAITPHVLMLEKVAQAADSFDVIHYHVDQLHFPLARRLGTPHVTTLHGRLDLAELQPLYDEFHDMPVVSISMAQRAPLPRARWVGTVHHGLPRDLHRQGDGRGGYLAFLGRISPEKRPDRAVRIAAAAGMPLRIAAKVDDADRAYFEQHIRPLLEEPHVEFLGEIDEEQKSDFLGNALALLFPVDWPEPFGLVMIEAMACGTPVVAYPRGSVPEVVEPGVTGFLCSTVEEAAVAVHRASRLDRKRIRRIFEARFSVERMANDYVRVYRAVVDASRGHDRDRSDPGLLLHPGRVAEG